MGRSRAMEWTVIGILLCGIVAFCGFALWVVANAGMPGEQGGHTFVKKVYGRHDLEKEVIGKTLPQVHFLLGEPHRRSNNGDDAFWVYEGITRDPANGRVDPHAVIWYRRARAVDFVVAEVPPTLPATAPKVYGRAEFDGVVSGRTMAELRRDLDPPGRMSDATGEAYWVYYKTVRNPADGRIDFLTLVRFRDGVATAVEH